MRFHFSFATKATPDQALGAFIDFGPERPEIWKETLDPTKYEVREVGDDWAVVREGTARPSIWAIERYEWSRQARTVTWGAVDSNFSATGSGVEVTITPRPAGGSHVEATWHRSPKGLRGVLIVPLARLVGPRTFPAQWARAVERYAERHGGLA
jgi:hypothetical protein